MQTYAIHIDGLAYQGESVEEYETNVGADGWHVPNQGALNDLLIGPGEPYRISGPTNLNSHIQRIFKRIRDRRLTAKQIVITVNDE